MAVRAPHTIVVSDEQKFVDDLLQQKVRDNSWWFRYWAAAKPVPGKWNDGFHKKHKNMWRRLPDGAIEMKLGTRASVFFDADDLGLVQPYQWRNQAGRARGHLTGSTKDTFMHYVIKGKPPARSSMKHFDGENLNNRRKNLYTKRRTF